jgi:hypothetical protein
VSIGHVREIRPEAEVICVFDEIAEDGCAERADDAAGMALRP